MRHRLDLDQREISAPLDSPWVRPVADRKPRRTLPNGVAHALAATVTRLGLIASVIDRRLRGLANTAVSHD